MRRRDCISVFLVLIAFTHLFAADHVAAENLPAAEGQAVINYIIEMSNYQKWALWPGHEKFYKGQHPHGALLTTYVSEEAFKAIQGKAGVLPSGAFVVKENYSQEKQLGAITVMYKKSGYNPAGGDWFWLKYKPDGTIEKEGKVGGCIGCHAAVKGNDWLFTGPVK